MDTVVETSTFLELDAQYYDDPFIDNMLQDIEGLEQVLKQIVEEKSDILKVHVKEVLTEDEDDEQPIFGIYRKIQKSVRGNFITEVDGVTQYGCKVCKKSWNSQRSLGAHQKQTKHNVVKDDIVKI